MSTEFEFRGKQKMIDAFDKAVELGCKHETTDAIRQSLIEMFHDPEVELPECCFEKIEDHYARRELYRSDSHGYSVVAMTWAPQQGTPIHDHSGLWCVESVWQGALEITPYELIEKNGDTDYCFRKTPCLNATVGSAGKLIPPHEYHTIHNLKPDSAISLHIYEKPMVQSAVFIPAADSDLDGANADIWTRKECKVLTTDC